MKVIVEFRVRGTLPREYGYPLYSSISSLFDSHLDIAVGRIRSYVRSGDFIKMQRSVLPIRCRLEDLPRVIGMAGQTLWVDGSPMVFGIFSVREILPNPTIYSPIVVIKTANGDRSPESFKASLSRQLASLSVQANVEIGNHRWLKIKDVRHIGYSVHLSGLTDVDSVAIQENGLGGKLTMGCGFFHAIASRQV